MSVNSCRSCKSCFFDEKFPGVTIEENGNCNFCNSRYFLNKKEKQVLFDIEKLQSIAADLKKQRKGKYDCVIGASGGLDSSYILYVAKKILKLNPLAVNYDSGFVNEIASDNLKTICNKLGIDLKVLKSTKGYNLKYIKFTVLALKDVNAYWGICKFCHYILSDVIFKTALEVKATTILKSLNLYEDELYVKTSLKVKFMLKNILQLNPVELLKFIFYSIIAQYYLIRLKLEFYLPPISNIFKIKPKMPKGLKEVNITDFVKWDIGKMVEALEKEAGWRIPKGLKLPMRFDCKIGQSFLNHSFKRATGITTHGIICNNLIYDGTKTKNELKDTNELYDDTSLKLKEMMKELGID